MIRFLVNRFVQGIVVILAVITITFALAQMVRMRWRMAVMDSSCWISAYLADQA